jgi:hypothetical protein
MVTVVSVRRNSGLADGKAFDVFITYSSAGKDLSARLSAKVDVAFLLSLGPMLVHHRICTPPEPVWDDCRFPLV